MIKSWLKKIWLQWLNQRLPAQQTVVLDRTNIFIFPTAFGGCYLIVCVVLFILGTNYQNNLVVILSMLFTSIFLTTLLRCYQNLAGLAVTAVVRGEFFAAQPLSVSCQVKVEQPRHGFSFNYKDQPVTQISLLENDSLIALSLRPKSRGIHALGRLTLASIYPLGLFRAWTDVDLAQQIVVFPAPLPYQADLSAIEQEPGQFDASYQVQQAGDSFGGLKAYRIGESLKHVAWKQVAQGRGMFIKYFEQQIAEPKWLDLDRVVGADIEQKLSYLTDAVINLSSSNQSFGMNLYGHKLAVATGANHRVQALKLLACYGVDHG